MKVSEDAEKSNKKGRSEEGKNEKEWSEEHLGVITVEATVFAGKLLVQY